MQMNMNEAVTHLFDERVHLTGVIEYGISWSDLLGGKVIIPAQGARFDISFEGELSGAQLSGSIRGVDYLEVRPDGKFMLNIQAAIVTNDGETIALHEDGVLTPDENGASADLHLTMKFSTFSEKYDWLNQAAVWAIGKVDMSKGEVIVSAFAGSAVPELTY